MEMMVICASMTMPKVVFGIETDIVFDHLTSLLATSSVAWLLTDLGGHLKHWLVTAPAAWQKDQLVGHIPAAGWSVNHLVGYEASWFFSTVDDLSFISPS